MIPPSRNPRQHFPSQSRHCPIPIPLLVSIFTSPNDIFFFRWAPPQCCRPEIKYFNPGSMSYLNTHGRVPQKRLLFSPRLEYFLLSMILNFWQKRSYFVLNLLFCWLHVLILVFFFRFYISLPYYPSIVPHIRIMFPKIDVHNIF